MIFNKSIHFEKKKCSAGRNAKSHKIKIHEITFAKKNTDLVVNINIGLQRGNRGSRGRPRGWVTRGNRADVTRGSTVFLNKNFYPRPRGFAPRVTPLVSKCVIDYLKTFSFLKQQPLPIKFFCNKSKTIMIVN